MHPAIAAHPATISILFMLSPCFVVQSLKSGSDNAIGRGSKSP
jgi:hypothetical protein